MCSFLHCNHCGAMPRFNPEARYCVTTCFHLLCNRCATSTTCNVCGTKAGMMEVNDKMSKNVQAYFIPMENVFAKLPLETSIKVVRFQETQEDRLDSWLMRGLAAMQAEKEKRQDHIDEMRQYCSQLESDIQAASAAGGSASSKTLEKGTPEKGTPDFHFGQFRATNRPQFSTPGSATSSVGPSASANRSNYTASSGSSKTAKPHRHLVPVPSVTGDGSVRYVSHDSPTAHMEAAGLTLQQRGQMYGFKVQTPASKQVEGTPFDLRTPRNPKLTGVETPQTVSKVSKSKARKSAELPSVVEDPARLPVRLLFAPKAAMN